MRRWTLWSGCSLLAILLLALIGCGEGTGNRDVDRAIKALRTQQYVRAKALLEKAINRHPGHEQNAMLYNYLGIVSWKLGQLEEAVDAFEDSRRLNLDLFEPTYNLGVLMYEVGNQKRAEALLDEAALVNVGDTRALEYLGYIYRAGRQWESARRVLYDALGRAPESERCLTALAIIELQLEGPRQAISYLLQALEKNPDYAPALFNLGYIYSVALNRPDQAAAYYNQFLQQAPSGILAEYAEAAVQRQIEPASMEEPPVEKPKPPLEETLRRETPVASETLEVLEIPEETPLVRDPFVQREPPVERQVAETPRVEETPVVVESTVVEEVQPVPVVEAPPADERLVKARKAVADGRTDQAVTLYVEAAKAVASTRPRRAEEIYQEAVDQCFDQPAAHYAYGQFRLTQGRELLALKSFKQTVMLQPESAVYQRALAQAAIDSAEYDSALVALRKAISLDPQHADSYWSLAQLYDEQLGLPEKAIEVLRDFQRLFPDDPRVLVVRERITEKEPESKPVQREARKERKTPEQKTVAAEKPIDSTAQSSRVMPVRKLQIKHPRVRNVRAAVQAFNRGTMYQSREDWDRALYYYRRAVENDDRFAQAFFNLGVVYRVKGDLDLAKDAYLEAVKLQPDMTNARYNLALVYWDLQQFTAAETQVLAVLKKEPKNAYANMLMAMLYARNPQTHSLARGYYKEFLRLAPEDPLAAQAHEWLRSH